MKSFSLKDREKNLEKFQKQEFDLLIIGGGITGAGVARDASMRGLKVALIESRDFASGTSSRSSKLIHGGIRYLENMDFKLVYEALNERSKLFEIAPHLVHPLRFMIPLYKDSRVGRFKMGLGMWLYDVLSLFQTPEMHENLNALETVMRMPTVLKKGLTGSFIYSDAYMDDDRLTIETLRSANEHGALCANYVHAEGAEFFAEGSKKVKYVKCLDKVSQKHFKISAKHVVSCVGPWTDELGESIIQKWKKILRPTKGVHLTFSKERLKLDCAVVMAAEKSNRIVFGIPRHEMVIVGTTDTDFKDHPENVICEAEDVEYLLKITNHYFPGAKLTPKDIVSSYAGVRPLVADESSSEGKTSREHTIFTLNSNITFVAGGKYTTYRLMAEQIVDECLRYFPIEQKARLLACQTNQPLNEHLTNNSLLEADLLRDVMWHHKGISESDINILFDRHAYEAEEIISNTEYKNLWEIEAEHAIKSTMCFNLVDFYTRRSYLFLAFPDQGISLVEKIAEVFANLLGWDSSLKLQQIDTLKNYVNTQLDWKNKFLDSI